MQHKIRTVIVGYGNVGRGVIRAINRNPDMRLSGIITRRPEAVREELMDTSINANEVPIFPENDFQDIVFRTDVAILCGGSATDLPKQGPKFAKFFTTVDSFDTHADILKYFRKMNQIASRQGNVSVISAGWDPGTFSLERIMGSAFVPDSERYTFWGEGVSQGHSDAVRRIPGVLDARQYTVPNLGAMQSVQRGENPVLTTRDKHRRVVYVVAEEGANLKKISRAIVTMPKYFVDYDTEVHFITKKQMKADHVEYPHAGSVITSGKTAKGKTAVIEYRNEWKSNPDATGGILVACARAACRLHRDKKRGAFTMADIPPAYYHPCSREELLAKFM